MAKPSTILTALGSVVYLSCFALYAQGQDWPSRGRDNSHNPVVAKNDIPVDFKLLSHRVKGRVRKEPQIENVK